MPRKKSKMSEVLDDVRLAAVRRIAKILIVAAPAFDPKITPGDKEFMFSLTADDIMELRALYVVDKTTQEKELMMLRELSAMCGDFYYQLADYRRRAEGDNGEEEKKEKVV